MDLRVPQIQSILGVEARQDKTKHPGTRLPVAQFDGGRPLVKVDIVGKEDWTLDRKSKAVTR